MKGHYEGQCMNGPLQGQLAVSRFSKGFLLVDKVEELCWIYEWDKEDKCFYVRDPEGEFVHTSGEKNRYRAAEEPNYDVIAAPWIGGDKGNEHTRA